MRNWGKHKLIYIFRFNYTWSTISLELCTCSKFPMLFIVENYELFCTDVRLLVIFSTGTPVHFNAQHKYINVNTSALPRVVSYTDKKHDWALYWWLVIHISSLFWIQLHSALSDLLMRFHKQFDVNLSEHESQKDRMIFYSNSFFCDFIGVHYLRTKLC